MTLPTTDTRVSYPSGALASESRVVHVEPYDEHEVVLLDETAAHPVDAGWPDQGPDLGVIRSGDGELPLLDVVVGATDGTEMFLGDAVPVRRGTEGWAFVVGHVVASGSGLAEGETVRVEIDAAQRGALSRGHTACHLASLALNRAVADRWTKPVREDALGTPDFDNAAIASSTIVPDGSIDVFRLNKSLRRKGFVVDGLADELPDVQASANTTLAEWVATDAAVRIDRDGDGLTDARFWVCETPEGSARIACGGTHATSLGELGSVRVELTLGDDEGTTTLTMRTTTGD